jgi:mono/diheme cytochrome c family protein
MVSLRLLLLISAVATTPARGGSEVEEGRRLVELNCSGCHAIGLSDASPHRDAPPFRTLSERYPNDTLAEVLSRGIPIGHPDMPDFLATSSQIDEIVAYILSLQSR